MTKAQKWDDLPLVLTADEAAEILRVTVTTIKKMCADGRLPAAKVGRAWRLNRDDVLAYLRGEAEAEDN
jgi:excisionase family DNA binding protein